MTKVNFGGVVEDIVTRKDFPIAKARKVLKNETVAVLGYGVQGQAQALNLRDNGIKVIVGQRKPSIHWDKALKDGWVPGKTLFSLENAAQHGSILLYLLSDAGQKEFWPTLVPYLTSGKTLVFGHGFSITYRQLTHVIPPKNIDVVLVAPKGSGLTFRQNFLKGSGLNASYAIFQDMSKKALEKCLAVAMTIGICYLFPTTFEKEVFCNLTGERGVLLGALTGIIEAQYAELRRHKHSPSEAFQETVETLTQSLLPIMAEKGIEWMYANCSTTAQRGAIDWKKRFRKAVKPVFEELYESVKNGKEAKIVLKKNSQSDYRKKLDEELRRMARQEIWKTGKAVRNLRPSIGS